MTKITPDHLTRRAIVYVRQSTPYQVTNNLESQRRQYGLVERARQLGWSEARVIDDDLGRSDGGREQICSFHFNISLRSDRMRQAIAGRLSRKMVMLYWTVVQHQVPPRSLPAFIVLPLIYCCLTLDILGYII